MPQKRLKMFTSYEDKKKRKKQTKSGKEAQNEAKAYVLLGYLFTKTIIITYKEVTDNKEIK